MYFIITFYLIGSLVPYLIDESHEVFSFYQYRVPNIHYCCILDHQVKSIQISFYVDLYARFVFQELAIIFNAVRLTQPTDNT